MHHQVEARREADGVALACRACGQHGKARQETWLEDMNAFVARHAHGLGDRLGGLTDAAP